MLLRCVCKAWLYLISDPNFAKSHFELAAAPTRRCLFIQSPGLISYDLDALFDVGHVAVKVSLPFNNPSKVDVVDSCRGLILLDKYPHLIIWNPSTGAQKQIPYSHIISLRNIKRFRLLAFGHDASEDDYLVGLAWRAKTKEDHFDLFSLTTNSWKNFEVALPNPLMNNVWRRGLFSNGAFHWLAWPCYRDDPILRFDLKERSFSGIPLPERVVMSRRFRLMELGGCLALCIRRVHEGKLKIWVMKEYKVQSSWTLYEIFDAGFRPICLSSDGDIIGFDDETRRFAKYNARGQQLEHFGCQQQLQYATYTMYTGSLLSLPNDNEDDKKGM